MYILSDILTYMRRIIKTPNESTVPDSLLIDYINRFWVNDVDLRLQMFDLKTKYSFITTPGVDQYNMPLYSAQYPPSAVVDYYPVYQGFTTPCFVNGINVPLYTQKTAFYNIWPNILQQFPAIAVGNNITRFSYQIQIPLLPLTSPQNPPFNPILRGHLDMAGVIHVANALNFDVPQDPPILTQFPTVTGAATNIDIPVSSIEPRVYITSIDSQGNNIVVTDSGVFFGRPFR